jgi:hypothetical protein
MSNTTIEYVVGAGLGVIGLTAFCMLVLIPAVTAHRGFFQRAGAVILSLYVLAALIGVGIAVGALIVINWPRVF